MRNEIEAFVSNKYSKGYSEEIQKSRAMAIAPRFYVRDNTHGYKFWWDTKFTKMSVKEQWFCLLFL
jgi:hypothetical protein